VVFQVAAEYGCKAIGIELRHDLAEIANKMQISIEGAVKQLGKRMGEVTLIEGDATKLGVMLGPLTSATVIFMNNFCYPTEMEVSLMHLFQECLTSGCRVLALKVSSLRVIRVPSTNSFVAVEPFSNTKGEN